ncbi:crossover junction endodeoxyribonuclease RuvC [bacterium]|nr:crossover junction endodeoxyribonuclease RuvC [bacterium]
MRVLGIDPGYAIVGWGVVDYAGGRFAPVAYGAVCTDKDTPFEQRLAQIYQDVCDICRRYQPGALSLEKLYYQHNQTTVIGVAEARGVILLAAAQYGIPVYEYTPMQIKQAVTGYGKAVKKQIQEMTRILLHLPEIPRPDDTADALAMAVAHCHCAGNRLSHLPGVSRQASDRER